MNVFDAKDWIGKEVAQVTSDPGNDRFVGRTGTVEEAIIDELGRVHCKTREDGVWCPARHLAVVTRG